MSARPTVIIACRVPAGAFAEAAAARHPGDLHGHRPAQHAEKLAAALQAEIDALSEPSNVIVGYGLCGNGLVGVKSGPHTLIVPRTHDCVAIFLGSHQRYVQRFFANPNTYYLTRGWLDAKDEPLQDYLDYVRDYDEETADYLVEMKVPALSQAHHGRFFAAGVGRVPAHGDARGRIPAPGAGTWSTKRSSVPRRCWKPC